MRGQLVVQQVGDVQVDDLPARPALEGRLQRGDIDLELAPGAADPDVARGGQLFGQLGQLGELLGGDVEDPHLDSVQRWCSRRAASSAK